MLQSERGQAVQQLQEQEQQLAAAAAARQMLEQEVSRAKGDMKANADMVVKVGHGWLAGWLVACPVCILAGHNFVCLFGGVAWVACLGLQSTRVASNPGHLCTCLSPLGHLCTTPGPWPDLQASRELDEGKQRMVGLEAELEGVRKALQDCQVRHTEQLAR